MCTTPSLVLSTFHKQGWVMVVVSPMWDSGWSPTSSGGDTISASRPDRVVTPFSSLAPVPGLRAQGTPSTRRTFCLCSPHRVGSPGQGHPSLKPPSPSLSLPLPFFTYSPPSSPLEFLPFSSPPPSCLSLFFFLVPTV